MNVKVNITVLSLSPIAFLSEKTIVNCLIPSKWLENESISNDACLLRNPSAAFIMTSRSIRLSTRRILEVYENISTVYSTSLEISIYTVYQARHRCSFQNTMSFSGVWEHNCCSQHFCWSILLINDYFSGKFDSERATAIIFSMGKDPKPDLERKQKDINLKRIKCLALSILHPFPPLPTLPDTERFISRIISL